MNIVLYGISEELAQRTAMHYGFALCRPFETGTEEENRFWLQPVCMSVKLNNSAQSSKKPRTMRGFLD